MGKRYDLPIDLVDPKDVRSIVVSGTELAEMSSEKLDHVLLMHQEIVFARTSPQQKLIIVEGMLFFANDFHRYQI